MSAAAKLSRNERFKKREEIKAKIKKIWGIVRAVILLGAISWFVIYSLIAYFSYNPG